MRAIETIRSTIPEEIFNFTQIASALNDYSKPKDALSALLRKEEIFRVRKGLYVFGDFWRKKQINHRMLANLIYGPSLLSLEFILSDSGLIPEGVYEYTSISTGRSRVFTTPVGRYSYKQVSLPRFTAGSQLITTQNGNYFAATPIKALADKIWFDKRFKPTSPSSYEEYLSEDLRIDEDILNEYVQKESLDDINAAYSSQKISWFLIFLKRKFAIK